MLHNQLLYSFYSGGKLTIRMIHVHIVVKSDTQVRYVTNSPFSFSPKLWHKHSYRQIPRSFLSSHFPSPYHLAPLLFPLLRFNPILYFTRTTHAHDASHRTAPTRMCALCMWVGHGMTMVESNMKREHNLYLACEDSPQRAFFLLFSSCPLSFYCTLTSLLSFLQCRNCRLRSVFEPAKCVRCGGPTALFYLHCQEALFFRFPPSLGLG